MFERKIWMDRQSEHPARRRLLPVSGAANTYEVERDEGLILEEGDAFDKKNMNDLEQRIAGGFAESAIFSAAFRLESWQKSGSTWMQSAPCQGMKAAYHTGAPWFRKTGVQKTDEQLQAAFDLVVGGYLETLDGKIRATLYGDKPSCDVKLFFQRRTLGEDGGGGSAEALEFATSQEVQQMLDEELGKGGA